MWRRIIPMKLFSMIFQYLDKSKEEFQTVFFEIEETVVFWRSDANF